MVKTSSFFQKSDIQRVGILGGTFNPPHLGHLRLAEEVAELHELSRILFMPSLIPPHKYHPEIASPEHRLEMTRLACLGNDRLEVSDLEIRLKGPSYTINTLKALKEQNLETFFIMGTDSLKEISTWKDYQQLFELSHFLVVKRPGTDFFSAWRETPESFRNKFTLSGECFVHESSGILVHSTVEGLNVSSTTIRNLLKQGKSIRYLVPESVRSYILEHRLYESPKIGVI
ncbi:nicotinate-nucleotide adenylyltransferase [Desulfomonile tiedjei]|uniref:Probable nicotinate-nucleotide adenylyltransferase n=1 Tax=Desulfomonile tiedjei (strain ATCC 49306 / DSM 6799 / DCB-1) TaxID=706587 RepID=I4CCR9_DESTA|nr:nicotinate-nucleotide adenylyltransferase [Desulfomonile tiedjei]AFM27360.1 nicotinate/nicotinamide nucleotide adenylyltransferase [Desulfomonile tiedjei DSM 6799]